MLQTRTQILCAWSGVVGVSLFCVAFFLAGWIPLPPPTLTAEQVAAHYQVHTSGLRFGMTLMVTAGMFTAPLVALISVHLWRVEKKIPIMTFTQLSAGSVAILFFMIPGMLWIVATFRPDRPPEITHALNDMAWVMIVIAWAPAFTQNMAIAVAILNDKSVKPLFQRWVGFLNIWVALLYVGGGVTPWFKTGPFAWNGLLAFWVPGAAFVVWFVTMMIVLVGIIKRQARDESTHGKGVETRESGGHRPF